MQGAELSSVAWWGTAWSWKVRLIVENGDCATFLRKVLYFWRVVEIQPFKTALDKMLEDMHSSREKQRWWRSGGLWLGLAWSWMPPVMENSLWNRSINTNFWWLTVIPTFLKKLLEWQWKVLFLGRPFEGHWSDAMCPEVHYLEYCVWYSAPMNRVIGLFGM